MIFKLLVAASQLWAISPPPLKAIDLAKAAGQPVQCVGYLSNTPTRGNSTYAACSKAGQQVCVVSLEMNDCPVYKYIENVGCSGATLLSQSTFDRLNSGKVDVMNLSYRVADELRAQGVPQLKNGQANDVFYKKMIQVTESRKSSLPKVTLKGKLERCDGEPATYNHCTLADCSVEIAGDVVKTDAAQSDCEKRGGRWQGTISGRGRLTGCNMPTKDGGKACTRGEDCESVCVDGKCYGYKMFKGCAMWKGQDQMMCFE